jgi:exodeoxyribonuclease V alpha subunit
MDFLTGSVERITYYNSENGYSVVRLRPEQGRQPHASQDGLVTATGNLPELAAGESLRLQGKWVNHPKHGWQFQVEICEQVVPATLAGIQRYLGSGLVKGIGPRLAERIVRQFGVHTLEVIETRPECLREVPDIGPKRSLLIARAWEEQKQVKEIMLFLHSHGVSTNLAVKIYKQYGDQSLGVVQSDPYRLARDIFGVGFKTADKIAQALGLPADHPSRIEAGIVYILNEMSGEGHVFSPANVLLERAVDLLAVSPELVQPALERLAKEGRLHQENLPFLAVSGEYLPENARVGEPLAVYGQNAVYLAQLYYGEIGVSEKLRTLASAIPSRLIDLPPDFVSIDPHMSAEQRVAIRTALSHPLSVLTGGPGTGKTTCLKALISILENAHKRYVLTSPTGRAAKRLSEATGQPASTIHRLLGYSPGEGFKFNADKPLDVDLIVVDETSMLELVLANHLLKALQPGTHLLLVGDVDQLPSVGAGDVLRDIIASEIAPVTRLNLIFRQAEGSHIITNAHRINQGKLPLFPKESQDFFLFPAETPEEAAMWVEEVVCERIPHKFGLHPRNQIQVLAPMYRGPAGVNALNERLQNVLNPSSPIKPEKSLFGQVFRVGDKVMQVRNNYDKDVFNGDIGSVTLIDPIEQKMGVDYEGHRVEYEWSEADQLVLAYSVSVHKAQGSEFPAVVVPFLTANYLMLQRNLLYTAVTRAKQLCVLVGSRRALGIAVRNNKVADRYTALDWRLRGR